VEIITSFDRSLIAAMDQKDDELERFRQAWKEEVSAKLRRDQKTPETRNTGASASSSSKPAQKREHRSHRSRDISDDLLEPRTYHDIEPKEHGHRLGDESRIEPSRKAEKAPITALDYYEKAVEQEGQGSLGGAVNHYRKAFKLDPRVQEKYKTKHFPNPKAPAASSSNPAAPASVNQSTFSELINEFSHLNIEALPPPTELSPAPPCPISRIPDEILVNILLELALTDPPSFARLSQVCKRLTYLVATEDRIWQHLCTSVEHGLGGMYYSFACDINASPIQDFILPLSAASLTATLPALITTPPLTPTYPTYRSMYRSRPRLRFAGCYISTVNYTRPGAAATTWSWNAPVLIVTYSRYLRFYRDGSVISLLSSSEPTDVIPWLARENAVPKGEIIAGGAPGSGVMKEALRGRWRLTGDVWGEKARQAAVEGKSVGDGDGDGDGDEEEREGEVVIETEGVVPKYVYKMQLTFGSAGKGARNNKLAWKGFWSYNRLTDDWGEFGMKNYKPFYWSRVKRYENGA
jgi:F-box protein 9